MAFDSRPTSLRRIRFSARAPRWVLLAVCATLCAAGLRAAFAAPATPAVAPAAAEAEDDDEVRALAEAFARTFLAWDPAAAQARLRDLRRLAPGVVEELPDSADEPRDEQVVSWSAVAADEPTETGRRITVLTETTGGLVALVVLVSRGPDGLLAVDDLPAIVGPPATSGDVPARSDAPVSDEALDATVKRALRSYLGQRADALSADLVPGARVVVPEAPLRLAAFEDTTWAVEGREVRAVVRARSESNGAVLALAYRVGVVRQAGRWFVRWIGTQQSSGGRSR
jgi:hypothetical protein